MKKICIYIPAYNVEKTLPIVMDRIPETLRKGCREILIIDNASRDGTYLTAVNYKRSNRLSNMTVIKNHENLGYGGSQKKAYRHAVEKGYDVIVMLHGDAQYAPEKITYLLEPILKGGADMVFGSRMRGNPLQGRMPVWKLAGNRALTAIQNLVLGTNLSEFHSGFRAYRCSSLKCLPFELCSNDYLFDTDIIIQFVIKKMKIMEVPIPTYYGRETKSPTLLQLAKYSASILASLFYYLLHKHGVKKIQKFSV